MNYLHSYHTVTDTGKNQRAIIFLIIFNFLGSDYKRFFIIINKLIFIFPISHAFKFSLSSS